MKASRKSVLALVGAMAMTAAVAAPSVEIVSVQQQYPWTNTVDIVYNVAGVESETNGYFVVFTPTTSTGESILDVNGQKSVQVALKGSGVYSTQWFPQTNQQYTACKMTPSVFRGAAKDYMIIDLENWTVAYEPMATQAASNQRYQANEYKTRYLVLRRVAAGPYEIGEAGATSTTIIGSASNPRHTVMASRDFYAAIYEMTEAQYARIMRDDKTVTSTLAQNATWNTARGGALVAATPGPSGTFGILNRKLNLPGQFDLGTHAMWEIAARAGELGTWLSGNDMAGLTEYAWVLANNTNKISQEKGMPVGTRRANNWGLYDVTGNKWEHIRDASNTGDWSVLEKNTGDALIPNTVAVGNGCILLSGGFNYDDPWNKLSMIHTGFGKSSAAYALRTFYYPPAQ